MRTICIALILVCSTAYADFSVTLDAGRLRVNATTPLPNVDNTNPSNGGSLLLLVAANGDGVFSNTLSPGNYVSGNDIVLGAGGFNTTGGTDETLTFFLVPTGGLTLPPNDRVALRWFPGITYAQYKAGVLPVAGQHYGTYNPRTSIPPNSTDNPDGGDPWTVPSSGAINLNFFTTDSGGGGTQQPSEGYASFIVSGSPTPTPTATPTPTVTVTPTVTPTITPTPTVSPSGSPIPTPSIPPTPSPIPTPSATPTASVVPTPSATPNPSITPTPNPSASPTPPVTGDALLNISTRARAQTGDNVLIGGFILGGDSATKQVVVRALGPSLGNQGVASPLLDPSLQLFDSSGNLLASNNDWMSNTNAQEISDVGLAPTDPRESAILTTLSPGNFTAVVTGSDSTTNNIALVEVYALDSTNPPELLNISTRTSVGTDQDQMIAGLIVGGTTAEAVVVRGLGPSLSSSSITNPLPNPTLTIYDSSGIVIGQNDNWQDDPGATGVQAVGLAPTNPLESAILLTLPPGTYTAVLSDVNGATGVALVEVYNVTEQSGL